jgi:hypothetical protein
MLALRPDNPLAVAVTEAIRSGDLAALKRLLGNNPGLATARIGTSRTAKLRLVGFGPACHFPEHLRGSSRAKLAHLRRLGLPVRRLRRFGCGVNWHGCGILLGAWSQMCHMY